MGASCVRWTADTERAFVLALELTGRVDRAAAAIGRAPSVCYQRRARSPDFAAAWAAAVAALGAAREAAAREAAARDAGAGDAVPAGTALLRTRADGWTQQRQRAFTRALADTGRWGEAAKRVGISLTSVQRLRRRSPAFDAACLAAIDAGAPSLIEVARQRAIDGWEEPIFHGGQQVGTRRRHSESLMQTLLAHEAASGAPRRKPYPTPEQTDASILRKLRAMTAHEATRRRAAELAWCDRMVREGKAP